MITIPALMIKPQILQQAFLSLFFFFFPHYSCVIVQLSQLLFVIIFYTFWLPRTAWNGELWCLRHSEVLRRVLGAETEWGALPHDPSGGVGVLQQHWGILPPIWAGICCRVQQCPTDWLSPTLTLWEQWDVHWDPELVASARMLWTSGVSFA